jgi:hypothetical protein
MSNIELAKSRDFGEIVNDTFIFIRQNFKPLLRYFFIFCGFFFLAAAVTSVMQQLKITSINNNVDTNSYRQNNPFALFGLSFFLNVFFIWIEYISITTTVLAYIVLYMRKGNAVPERDEMWGYFKFYFLKLLGTSFILGILIMVAAVFCLLPAVYLYPIFALIPPIMVMENASFGYAFNQSFKLIKENWWVTFGTLVVVIIVLYVASLVVIMPAAILRGVSLFSSFRKGTSVSTTATVITTLLSQVAHVFYILPTVAASLCYFNLNESKEGTGLIERINQFGTNTPDANTKPEEY